MNTNSLDISADEIASILVETPQVQEYKSAIISKKMDKPYPYDCHADLIRIKIGEDVAPDRVQFSTGNVTICFIFEDSLEENLFKAFSDKLSIMPL